MGTPRRPVAEEGLLRPFPARLAAGLVALALLACGRRGDPVAPGLRLPGAPTRVAISGPAGQLTVSWTPPKEDLAGRAVRPLSGYLVLRQAWPPASGPCASCPEDLSPVGKVDLEERRAQGKSETSWVDADAQPTWSYRYRVRALDAQGRPGPPSAAATVAWPVLANPRVEAQEGDGQAVLRFELPPWPAGVSPAGVRVYGPDGRKIAEALPDAKQVAVLGLQNGVPVTLGVRTAGRTSEGWDVEGPGALVTVVPVDRMPPLPPSDLLAFAEDEGVRLHWLPAGEEPYAAVLVLRAGEHGRFAEIARLPGDAASYLDTSAARGAAYLYTAVTVDAAGNQSLPAREARVRLP